MLISAVKKILLKVPSCVKVFKNNYPDLNFSFPNVIKWGAWLSAANYYCQNCQKCCQT